VSRWAILTTTAIALAIVVVVAIGTRVLARDRRAIHMTFAENKLRTLGDAADELGNDVEKIGEDLELAASLMTQTSSPSERERSLHAIAAITREYAALELRDASGQMVVRVVAPDASSDVLDRAAVALEETARVARERPGAFQASGPIGSDDTDLAWYRVFARRSPTNDDLVVAVVVDMRPLLSRLRLLEGPSSQLLVIGAHGRPAPSSNRTLAAQVMAAGDDRGGSGVERLVQLMRSRKRGIELLDENEARALGLPAAVAVAVTTPVLIEDGEPWALALVVSTNELRSQERMLLRRLLLGGAVGGLFLVALSLYFVHNARRAAALHERVRNADRLAHLTEKAEKILDHIPSGVLALTEDGRISDVNRWLSERLGRDVRGLTLESAFPALGEERIAEVRELIRVALQSRRELALHRVDISLGGFEGRASLHAVPLFRPLGEVHSLLVIEDLEAVRRIEDRLLQSEKLVTVGQLAAGIAHEIGTPLTIVRARAELAITRMGAEHALAGDQKIIVEQIDHVTKQISQLLDYVRSSPRREGAIDVGVALESIADLLHAESVKRDVVLSVDVRRPLAALRADPGQFQQVIVNLAVNALDACEKGGRVTLRARDGGKDRIVIEVEDDGHGIDPAIKTQIFDPFFTTKKRGRGTGLGLWVVAQLVHVHGGEIELDTGRVLGTLVRLTWPTCEPNT
jgi:two-component system, NtrC family, sensor histidine kinase HydH